MDKNLTKAVSDITGLFSKLAGPLADEVGQMLGDKAREYRIRNAVKIFHSVQRMLAASGIDPRPIAPRLFLPALEAASIEDSETLQEKWAALLANASDPRHSASVLPSFVEILKELTPYEAQLIDRLFIDIPPPGIVRFPPTGAEPSSPKPSDRGTFIGTFHDLQRIVILGEPVDQIPNAQQIALLVDDLVRLGLLDRLPWYPSSSYPRMEKLLEETLGHTAGESQYFLTPFGLAFINACTAPELREGDDPQP